MTLSKWLLSVQLEFGSHLCIYSKVSHFTIPYPHLPHSCKEMVKGSSSFVKRLVASSTGKARKNLSLAFLFLNVISLYDEVLQHPCRCMRGCRSTCFVAIRNAAASVLLEYGMPQHLCCCIWDAAPTYVVAQLIQQHLLLYDGLQHQVLPRDLQA